jgi:PKD repeat protein
LGTHTFKSYSTIPNGSTDPFPSSDTSSISFVVSNGISPNYSQDFESGSFPPDTKWDIVNGGNDCRKWSPVSGVSSSGVVLNNIAQLPCFGNPSTLNEDLNTPIFSVPCNATALILKFDVAYLRRTATSNDSLKVDISTHCGNTWTTIYNKSGNTASPNNFYEYAALATNSFFPSASNQWRTETLDLLSFVSATSYQVRFRFRGTSANGNNIYVDNVKFEGTTPGEIIVTQTGTDVLNGGYSNLPPTQVGTSSTTTYTITNTGSTNLVLSNPITISGTSLSLGTGFGATTLAHGATTTFSVVFNPTALGSTVGNVSFTTNDCDEAIFNFALNSIATSNPPVASFSATPLLACAGQTISFTNTSTNATSYSWNFGPNATSTTSTEANPTVTFLAGTETISLTTTNAFGSDVETLLNYFTAVPSIPTALPFVDGFVSATFPGTNWSIANANASATTWSRNTVAGVAPTTGNSLRFDNYRFNDSDDDEARIKPLQFTGLSFATLTFDVAYQRYNATYFDGLEVLVSTNCGGAWNSVYLKSNTVLATVPVDLTASAFVPTAAQWRNESVNLTPFIGNSNVLIAFKNLSVNGQFLYLDNINVTGVTSAATANFSVNSSPVCQGQNVTFTDASVGASSWNWNFGVGATPSSATGQGPHIVSYASSGTKTISLTVNGGSNSDQNVTVNPTPTTPSISAGGSTTFCAGGSVSLTSSASSGNQ